MKRILIIDCNAKLGGIQKALINYLKQESRENDVSVLFFFKSGGLLKEIPENVTVLTTASDFRYMGMSQADCVKKIDQIKRGFYAIISRFAGQQVAVGIASLTMRDKIPGSFDEVISFSHMSDAHSFFGGTPQYALKIKNAKKHVCFIHCDYLHSGNRSAYSDRIYQQFDQIICVSESTKAGFLQALPQMSQKVVARLNSIDCDEINRLANTETFKYDRQYINMLIVARMTKEKGIERIVGILNGLKSVYPFRLYIVGDGLEKNNIFRQICEGGLEDTVILLGEQANPYRYMKNADILLVPSYHEAAPVVFQEASELGVPVLTTRTTSADEMIGNRYGCVVDNTDEALQNGVEDVLNHPWKFIKRFQQSPE